MIFFQETTTEYVKPDPNGHKHGKYNRVPTNDEMSKFLGGFFGSFGDYFGGGAGSDEAANSKKDSDDDDEDDDEEGSEEDEDTLDEMLDRQARIRRETASIGVLTIVD